MRRFVRIDLGRERAPDETTVCKFRHLLEEDGLGKRLFEEVGRYLQKQGFKLSRGTMVDTTIISAPNSTKNRGEVHYRGLMKNANRLFAACALTNLFMVRKRLLRLHGA
jgi:IS5 family transposase